MVLFPLLAIVFPHLGRALAVDDTEANMIGDPESKTPKAWSARHTPGFREVGPIRGAAGVYGLGILERPRQGEQSTFSQVLTLEAGSGEQTLWYLARCAALTAEMFKASAEAFGKERVIYMPNGFDYGYPRDGEAQMLRHIANDRLLSAAESLGYRTCVYYVHFRLDSPEDRLRDLIMAKFPTSGWAADRKSKEALIKALHSDDYFDARQSAARDD